MIRSLFKKNSVQAKFDKTAFEGAFENSGIGMAIVGLDGSWVRVNASLCSIVGYSKEELLKRRFQDITHPEDLDTDMAFVNSLLEGKMDHYEMEKRYLHKQGHIVWIQLNGSIVRDADGKPLYFIAQVQDITSQKNYEVRINEARRKAELLMDVVPSGIFTVDRQKIITSWNKMAEKITGYSANEIVGQDCLKFALMPCREKCGLYSDDVEKPIMGRECTIITKDGVVKTIIKNAFLLKDENGNVMGGIESFDDISERKLLDDTLFAERERLEKINDKLRRTMNDLQERDQRLFDVNDELERANIEIERERTRLNAIIAGMGEGVLVTNEKNNIEIMNAKALQLFGFSSLEEMPDGYRKFFVDNFVKVLNESKDDVVIRELKVQRPKEMVFLVTLARLGHNSQYAGFVAVIRDVTVERELEQMKSDFVANVSHEVRSPMAPMKESLSLILDGTAGPVTEQQKKFLNILKNNIDRLLRLVNDLLDLSKLEAGRVELQKAPVNLNLLVKECLESLALFAQSKNISLGADLDDSISTVNCDHDRITQVVINLLNNSIKFTPDGGSIVAGTRAVSDGTVEVFVKDNGPGMTKEESAVLFDRYIQLSSKSNIKGTGLGLAISKAIIEMHGGQIWVESEKGAGSTFKFTLPLK